MEKLTIELEERQMEAELEEALEHEASVLNDVQPSSCLVCLERASEKSELKLTGDERAAVLTARTTAIQQKVVLFLVINTGSQL
jgi:hypothetical protein